MQIDTSHLRSLLASAAFAATALMSAAPAHADFCIQLNGGSFSGDLGFFRFRGTIPTTAGHIVSLRGRAAGLDPAFGTAVVARDGSYTELGVTFFVDASEGQFNVWFTPPGANSGSGYADYGTYDVNQSVTATVTGCGKEPVTSRPPPSVRPQH
jgi:hypothetical protein